MPFKPNYNQQRNDRNRAKEARKQEKLRRREEESERRRAAESGEPGPDGAAPDAEVVNGSGPGNA